MPVFDWKCDFCGVVETDIPVEVTIKDCPVCGEKMRKLYSPPTLSFSGTGWTPRFYPSK